MTGYLPKAGRAEHLYLPSGTESNDTVDLQCMWTHVLHSEVLLFCQIFLYSTSVKWISVLVSVDLLKQSFSSITFTFSCCVPAVARVPLTVIHALQCKKKTTMGQRLHLCLRKVAKSKVKQQLVLSYKSCP